MLLVRHVDPLTLSFKKTHVSSSFNVKHVDLGDLSLLSNLVSRLSLANGLVFELKLHDHLNPFFLSFFMLKMDVSIPLAPRFSFLAMIKQNMVPLLADCDSTLFISRA